MPPKNKIKLKTVEWIKKIHDALDVYDFSSVLTEIKKFEKEGKLTDEKRLGLAEIRERLYEYQDAIRVVLPELNYHEMMNTAPSKISLQMRLAHLLNLIGAKYVAQRILENIEEICQKRNIDGQKLYWAYIYIQVYFARTNNLFLKILKIMDKYQTQIPANSWIEGLCYMHKALAMHYVDDSKNALMLLKKLSQNTSYRKFLRGLIFRTLADIHADLQEYDKALVCLNQTEEMYKENLYTREKFLFHLTKARILQEMGNESHAKKIFTDALSYLKNNFTDPRDILFILYHLNQFKDFELLLPYKVAIRAHKTFRFHSYALGRPFEADPDFLLRLPKWFKNYKSESHFDCWLINKNDIIPCNYSEIDYGNLKAMNLPILDLFSGVKIDPNESKAEVLSETQANCLATVIGCGGVGVSQWLLYDNTYRHVRLNEVGISRVKDMVRFLKKSGEEIRRESNYYFYNFKAGEIILLSMHNLQVQGPEHYLKHLKREFTRKDLERIFNIKKSTAINWINEWKLKSIISHQNSGKETVYLFS